MTSYTFEDESAVDIVVIIRVGRCASAIRLDYMQSKVLFQFRQLIVRFELIGLTSSYAEKRDGKGCGGRGGSD